MSTLIKQRAKYHNYTLLTRRAQNHASITQRAPENIHPEHKEPKSYLGNTEIQKPFISTLITQKSQITCHGIIHAK